MSKHLRLLAGFCLLMGGMACEKSGAPDAAADPRVAVDDVQDAPTPPKVESEPGSYEIPLEQVQKAEGCLDWEKLFALLEKVPAGVSFRETSLNFEVAPGEGTGGERPTDPLITRLTRASFAVDVRDEGKERAGRPTVRQLNCQEISLTRPGEELKKWEIVSWKPTELTIESGKEQIVLIFEGGRSYALIRRYQALDYCAARGDRYDVTVETATRWDAPEKIGQQSEVLNRNYLVRVASSVMEVPPAIDDALTKSKEESGVSLGQSEIESLAAADLKPEFKKCPEPPPTPTPSPTPER